MTPFAKSSSALAALSFLASSLWAGTLDPDFSRIATYKLLDDREALSVVQDHVRAGAGKPLESGRVQDQLILLLESPECTADAKVFCCRQLTLVGNEKAVPVLAKLLPDPKISHMARYALEQIPGKKADEALRAALSAVKGTQKIGVIHSLGSRRDAQAVDVLARIMTGSDKAEAIAAAEALAEIGGVKAGRVLVRNRKNVGADLRSTVTDACIFATRGLVSANPDQAYKICESIYQDKVEPSEKRLAALTGMIRARPTACAKLVAPILEGEDAAWKTFVLRFVRETDDAPSAQKFAAQLPKLTPEDQVRLMGVMALQQHAPCRDVYRQAIARLVESGLPEVKGAATKALGLLAQSSSIALSGDANGH